MAELEFEARTAAQVVAARAESPSRRAIRRFLRHRLALLGLATIIVIVLLAILGDSDAVLSRPTELTREDYAFRRSLRSRCEFRQD